MAKMVKKSVIPFYLAAAVWLVWALAFSLYRVSDYVLCAVVSVIVFILGKAIFPDKTYALPDPPGQEKAAKAGPEAKAEPKAAAEPEPKPKRPSTGDAELDKILDERDMAISEMRRLNDAIADEKISAQIDHLEDVTGKIIDHVVEHPQKKSQITRFLNYYLPTTLKLLNAYDRMDAAGISGVNIDGTKGKIETMMDTVVAAFDKQLDALFGDVALDISTDITVMENLLAQEGLSGGLTAES